MIRPGAVVTISTLPKHAHARAMQNNAMMVPLMAFAIGDGGVSTISSAAGRKASSSSRGCGLYRLDTATFERLAMKPTIAPAGRISRKCAIKDLRGRPCGALDRARCWMTLADLMDSCLQTVQRRVAATCPDQVIVGAVFSQPAAVDGDEAVAPPNSRQPMRDDEDGAAFGKPRHVLLDDPLALIVERARRFVEDQDARVGNERARDGQTLALAAREAGAALAHDGVVAIGELKDEIMGAGHLRGSNDLFNRHRAVCQRDIVAHRAIEQDALLQHHADLAAQPGWIDHAEINAVDQNPPALGDVKPLNQLGESALARAGRADNAYDLSGGYAETDVMQHFRPIDPVSESDVFECDLAADCRQRSPARRVDRLRRGIENVSQSRNRKPGLVEVLPNLGKPQHRRAHPASQDVEGDELVNGEIASDDKPGAEIKQPGRHQLVDQLHKLACRVPESENLEARGDVGSELILPTALHLRFDRHRLERLHATDALH